MLVVYDYYFMWFLYLYMCMYKLFVPGRYVSVLCASLFGT